MAMRQPAGRVLQGHSAPGAPAQVASSIILWVAPGGPDGARSCLQCAEAQCEAQMPDLRSDP